MRTFSTSFIAAAAAVSLAVFQRVCAAPPPEFHDKLEKLGPWTLTFGL
jgi:hypothetical protein